jgi:MFS family permease
MANDVPALAEKRKSWYQGLTAYHWWVLVIGTMAWMFDCMDQRLFVLSREPALTELLGGQAVRADVLRYGKYVTAAMIVGWSVGGLFFGVVGDRWGRVKTLSVAILVYAAFTGLSGLALHWWDFCFYRFLMGCGIGGAFATAATLIAETLPPHARAFSLGVFQAISAMGNFVGAAIATYLVVPGLPLNLFGYSLSGWRVLFFIGILPGILSVFIMRTVREPEAWKQARQVARDDSKKGMGDIRGLFTHPTWRRHTLVGVGLAVAGVVGLWGIGFWGPELISEALKDQSKEVVQKVRGNAMQLFDLGSLLGMFAFTVLATRFGRRLSFALSLLTCYAVVTMVFLRLSSAGDAYWMFPMMGFVTLSIFGGYAIYFPEIYPTRLRATGTGFCYNTARVLAAALILGSAGVDEIFRKLQFASPFRAGAIAICTVYLLGLLVLIWAPETKDKPLPED